MIRVHVAAPLMVGAEVTLPPADAHHLAVVLRMAPGAELEVIDGHGHRFLARVASTSPLTAAIVSERPAAGADPLVALEFWLPLLKGGRADDLVRQLTELGVTRIVPWTGRRSVGRADGKAAQKLDRWRTIAREACQQCGRAAIPEIAPPAGLPEVGPGVFFYESGGQPARAALAGVAAEAPLRVLTGPEGGLDPDEVARLTVLGWRAAHLGPRILRADTAVVTAATLALSALGEAGF